MKKISLVIMAAGIGSRYGAGIKQLEKVGPNGEIIIDYSIYDALKAGFNEIIFIIREDMEDEFRIVLGDKISHLVPVKYVYQKLDDLPDGFSLTKGRTKPWGTAQAIWAGRGVIDSPFCVINADDFYGAGAYKTVYKYLSQDMSEDSLSYDYCMAGYVLENTLSTNGTVTRGICCEDKDHHLLSITETKDISVLGKEVFAKKSTKKIPLNPKSLVSLNMWGFKPNVLDIMGTEFINFLNSLKPGDISSEYLIPVLMGELISKDKVHIKVLPVHEKWFGMTYQEDRICVRNAIKKMVDKHIYGDRLFG